MMLLSCLLIYVCVTGQILRKRWMHFRSGKIQVLIKIPRHLTKKCLILRMGESLVKALVPRKKDDLFYNVTCNIMLKTKLVIEKVGAHDLLQETTAPMTISYHLNIQV